MIPRLGDSDANAVKSGPPLGVQVIRRVRGKDASLHTYRYSVLFMTFIAYACYHSSRKPFSIVKSVLDDAENNVTTINGSHVALYPFLPVNHLVSRQSGANGSYHTHWYYGSGSRSHGTSLQSVNASAPGSHTTTLKGWAPFNKKGGKGLLGDVDLAFLGSYAVGMYFAGHFADRVDLRYFLSGGMIGSGFFVCLFGMGYWFDVHSIYFFLVVQMMAGVLQTTGWPSVVAIVGKWFGKRRRGLIMGIWNAHTSVGNITGSLLAARGLRYGWGWSFLFPGLLHAAGGILMFFFLVVEPSDVGHRIPEDDQDKQASATQVHRYGDPVETSEKQDAEAGRLKEPEDGPVASGVHTKTETANTSAGDEETGLLRSPDKEEDMPAHYEAVGFLQAWRIPGVAPFAFCLFFSKLVAYTFLNWLPFYITQTKIGGKFLTDEMAGTLATLFDIGGLIGGVLAGHLSDRLNGSAITASGLLYGAIPALFLYRTYGGVSMTVNITLMMIAGMLVNGPYSLITTAVSADLGTHSSLKGNPRALATVTSIIDGTGSVGAAIGPLLTGYISELSWDYVFIFLMVSALIAGLLLTRLVIGEVMDKIQRRNSNFAKDIVRQDDGGGSLTQRLLNGRD